MKFGILTQFLTPKKNIKSFSLGQDTYLFVHESLFIFTIHIHVKSCVAFLMMSIYMHECLQMMSMHECLHENFYAWVHVYMMMSMRCISVCHCLHDDLQCWMLLWFYAFMSLTFFTCLDTCLSSINYMVWLAFIMFV